MFLDTLPHLLEKPYPQGYEAPRLWEYYQENPSLRMEEPSNLGISEEMDFPDTLILRAQIVADPIAWPFLEIGSGERIIMSDESLYTEEGRRILRLSGIQNISLIFEGLLLVPTSEGNLMPWQEGMKHIPWTMGEMLLSQRFQEVPPLVSCHSTQGLEMDSILSFGGTSPLSGNLLEAKSLFFFVEMISLTMLPQVRFLFQEERDLLMSGGEQFPSLQDLLKGGDFFFPVMGGTVSYRSVQGNGTGKNRSMVDIVMVRITG